MKHGADPETWTDENKTVALTSVCTPAATPFWYVARISEFEVFGKKNEKPATTEAATTEAPATTAAPAATTAAPAATTAAPSTEKTAEKSGCGSVAAYGVCMIVTALGAAFIRKKH